jgi:hypothetical protein
MYYDISQKSPLLVSGAVVGECPHGLEDSCIYLSLIRHPWLFPDREKNKYFMTSAKDCFIRCNMSSKLKYMFIDLSLVVVQG